MTSSSKYYDPELRTLHFFTVFSLCFFIAFSSAFFTTASLFFLTAALLCFVASVSMCFFTTALLCFFTATECFSFFHCMHLNVFTLNRFDFCSLSFLASFSGVASSITARAGAELEIVSVVESNSIELSTSPTSVLSLV